MEYYAATKRRQLLIEPTTEMALQGITLPRRKPLPKGYMLCESIHNTFFKWNLYTWRANQTLPRRWGQKGNAEASKGKMRDLSGDADVLYLDCININILVAKVL